jgi:hypothetical protein
MVNPALQNQVAKLASKATAAAAATAAGQRLPPLKANMRAAAAQVVAAPADLPDEEAEEAEEAEEVEGVEAEGAAEAGEESVERRGRKHDDEHEAAATAVEYAKARSVARSVANVLRALDKSVGKFNDVFPEEAGDESGKIAEAAEAIANAYTALNGVIGALSVIPKPKTRAPATAKSSMAVGTKVLLKDAQAGLYENTGAVPGLVGEIAMPAVNRMYKVNFGGKMVMVFALHLDVYDAE